MAVWPSLKKTKVCVYTVAKEKVCPDTDMLQCYDCKS